MLLGAHLDSWDLGTGALDDAAGCGIVIEAARQIGAAPEAPAAHDPRRPLRQRGARARRAARRTPRRTRRSSREHVAALEADLGQGPPLGFSWNAGPSAEAVLKADRRAARPDRRRRARGVRRRRRGPDLPAALGDPEPRALARRHGLLRLSPHGERQLRPHRSEDPGPVDGGRGDARLRARGDPGAARAHAAREARRCPSWAR